MIKPFLFRTRHTYEIKFYQHEKGLIYFANNSSERQDVKNILVLQKWRESTRKQMKVKSLCINALCEFLCFPILTKLTLKKI